MRRLVAGLFRSLLAARHLQQSEREVHACVDGECQRTPQPWIDLHQPVLAVRVHLEFNHGHAMPLQSAQKLLRIMQEPRRRLNRTSVRTCAAGERELMHTLVYKVPNFASVVVEELRSHAPS